MPEDRRFVQVEVRMSDGRVLIRSTCQRCGASRLVSHEDGSLAKWENGHDCNKGGSTML